MAVCLLGLLATHRADAQNYQTEIQPPADAVTVRQRPDFDAAGIRAGSFLLYPKAPISETYDDNVYATNTNRTSDYVTEVAPEIDLQSQWNRHSLGLVVASDLTFHAQQTTEDHTNVTVQQTGRLDVGAADYLRDQAYFQRYQESRTSIDDPRGVSPTKVTLKGGQLYFHHQGGAIFANLRGTVEDYSFHNAVDAFGAIINNHDRDRTSINGSFELGYDSGGLIRPFVQVNGIKVNFKDAVDDFGLNRDSSGYSINGGILFPVTTLIQGRIFGGYIARNFKDPALTDVSGAGYGAEINWSPTRTTLVDLNVLRTVNETSINLASSTISTSGSVDITQEVRENLLMQIRALVQHDKFAGLTATQTQWQGGINMTYLMNRNVRATLGYEHSARNISNLPGYSDFARNQVTISIQLQI